MPVYGIGADIYMPSKKLDYQVNEQNQNHQPFENFAPVITESNQSSYNYVGPTYVINSEGAYVGSKKAESVQDNVQDVSPNYDWSDTAEQSQSQSESNSQTNWTLIAAIAGVAILGAVLLVGGGKVGSSISSAKRAVKG